MSRIQLISGLLLAFAACGLAAGLGLPCAAGGQTAREPGVELSVAAPSGLNAAMIELASAFERKTGVRVRFTFGDSASLSSQIQKGADFDAFFSADANDVHRLVASGVAGSLTEYARDQLMLCISPMIPVELSPRNPLQSVRNKIISHVAILDPETTELGKITVEALTHGGAYDTTVRGKLSLAHDVSQVAQQLQSGQADAAVLPVTAVNAYGLRDARVVPIAPNLYRPLRMEAAVVMRSRHRREALELVKFAASPNGQTIFRRSGFGEVKEVRQQ
jgi:molybdate transport system substrate-binding protein